MRVVRYVSLTVAATITLLAGCGAEPQWNATRLPDDFPGLEFQLTGESGQPIDASSLRGRVVLLVFGYTACPDVCPGTLAKLERALARMPDDAANRTRVLFVSVDPERDTPAVLARYTDAFGPRFLGATAGQDRLRAFVHGYGGSFSRGPRDHAGSYDVSHPSGVYAFDATGRARLLIRTDATIGAIAEDVRQLAEPPA